MILGFFLSVVRDRWNYDTTRLCEEARTYVRTEREESLKFNYTLWAENNPRTRSVQLSSSLH